MKRKKAAASLQRLFWKNEYTAEKCIYFSYKLPDLTKCGFKSYKNIGCDCINLISTGFLLVKTVDKPVESVNNLLNITVNQQKSHVLLLTYCQKDENLGGIPC